MAGLWDCVSGRAFVLFYLLRHAMLVLMSEECRKSAMKAVVSNVPFLSDFTFLGKNT
jgi:hypothetical protein